MNTQLDPDYERAVAEVKAAGYAPADPLKMPLAEARAIQSRYFEYLGRDAPPVHSTEDFTLRTDYGPFKVRIHLPSPAPNLPVIVFARGAGWWAGNIDSHDRTARLVANKSGMAVCVVDYHCAPEARFPVQLNELMEAIRWLRAEEPCGIDPSKMVLMGESAGATLSALAAARLGDNQVSGLVLFYGNFSGPSERSREYSRWVWTNLLGSSELPADKAAVPVQQDVSKLPPTWLGVGEADPLVTDTAEFAERLQAAGIDHTVKRYPGLPHAFVMISGLYAGADASLSDAATVARTFVR